jgi:hypothetical protein
MCEHQHTELYEDQACLTTESGPEFVIEGHTYCLDCGAEVETPIFDFVYQEEL